MSAKSLIVYILSLLTSEGVPLYASLPVIFHTELISSELGSVSGNDRLPQVSGNVGQVVCE